MKEEDVYRLLIVDDNPAIHEDFSKILIRKNLASMDEIKKATFKENEAKVTLPDFIIDSAYNGSEAVSLVADSIQKKQPYALAFVDMRMPPGYDGIETISRIWKLDQNVQIVICTASNDYHLEEILAKLENIDNFLFFKKPFDMMEIRQAAYSLAKRWHVLKELRARLNQKDGQ